MPHTIPFLEDHVYKTNALQNENHFCVVLIVSSVSVNGAPVGKPEHKPTPGGRDKSVKLNSSRLLIKLATASSTSRVGVDGE